MQDSGYNLQDRATTLATLAPTLKKHPTLVIADNLESLLPGGEAPLEREQRLVLWETLPTLAKLKAGVLVTSRDLSLGDGKLAEGNEVAHLPLGGLHREDAYLLASNQLTDLQIDRARAPYKELRALLEQLDHHPLAIQLVLPALRTRPLEMILEQFADLLKEFKDDTATGRTRSLLASLQYSLNRLSEEQRASTAPDALRGGAMEGEILVITEIPEAAWDSLRPTLEQAALLAAEPGIGDLPFLRGQPGADDPALRERYAARYLRLAAYLYNEDTRHPLAVRALALHELPNLRRALDFLLEKNQLNAAPGLADCIISFLDAFGRLRERDEVQQLWHWRLSSKVLHRAKR